MLAFVQSPFEALERMPLGFDEVSPPAPGDKEKKAATT